MGLSVHGAFTELCHHLHTLTYITCQHSVSCGYDDINLPHKSLDSSLSQNSQHCDFEAGDCAPKRRVLREKPASLQQAPGQAGAGGGGGGAAVARPKAGRRQGTLSAGATQAPVSRELRRVFNLKPSSHAS